MRREFMDRIATLTELEAYLNAGLSLGEVVTKIRSDHGLVKVFDHSPEKLPGMTFRYFVMPLDTKGKPITKLAKGQTL